MQKAIHRFVQILHPREKILHPWRKGLSRAIFQKPQEQTDAAVLQGKMDSNTKQV